MSTIGQSRAAPLAEWLNRQLWNPICRKFSMSSNRWSMEIRWLWLFVKITRADGGCWTWFRCVNTAQHTQCETERINQERKCTSTFGKFNENANWFRVESIERFGRASMRQARTRWKPPLNNIVLEKKMASLGIELSVVDVVCCVWRSFVIAIVENWNAPTLATGTIKRYCDLIWIEQRNWCDWMADKWRMKTKMPI